MGKPAEFSARFDPSDRAHVMWLKQVCDLVRNPEHSEMRRVWLQNPLGVPMGPDDLLQTAEVHFVLAMHYVQAVFDQQALVL